ncbi:caspase recruitment domain-containing protein 8-like isoform X2 [Hemicordylus capensis]|uniref:caspase recruitment domain-containing protein 8-like isoform X2 n=1 Tax=Hemicordylus capensis TaxID=884348 RepID=UPI0023043B33|nr:caspase recruitment domain-containing protein 8-like isoform X2 [Hemicordylus capensis]
MTSGQECRQDSESEVSALEYKGNDSCNGSSESNSESESDTDEADDKSNEELEEKAPLSYCVKSGVNIQQHCEHCRIQQGQQEQVTPRRLARGQFWLKLDAEGIYQCEITGLIFEVTKAAVIQYSLLSWSKYAAYVKEPWMVGGPIFDVTCTSPSVLTSIQFPHALCLKDCLSDMTFKVFHFKSNGAQFEQSVDHSATHVKWQVSTLSPVGPLVQGNGNTPVYYHGVVILYKVVNDHPSLSFRVYVASNDDSFIKDVSKAIKNSGKKFIKIEKPPCQKLLQGGKKYRLISDPEAEITPEEIEFANDSLLKVKSYIEVYMEQPMDLTLTLVELESNETVWKAKLRECDWIQHNQNDNEPKRRTNSIRRRKSSVSFSEDELGNKRLKENDTSDGAKPKLTDQQLMSLAKKMGKNWKIIGIQHLGLSFVEIEQIEAKKEEDVNMYKFHMLQIWRDSKQNDGTAQSLYDCLNDDASCEVLDILKGFLKQDFGS